MTLQKKVYNVDGAGIKWFVKESSSMVIKGGTLLHLVIFTFSCLGKETLIFIKDEPEEMNFVDGEFKGMIHLMHFFLS